jgi:hypothetical protein
MGAEGFWGLFVMVCPSEKTKQHHTKDEQKATKQIVSRWARGHRRVIGNQIVF